MSTKDQNDRFKPKYKAALQAYRPYIFAPEQNLQDGLAVKDYSTVDATVTIDYLAPEIGEVEATWIDPYTEEAATFIDMLLAVDGEAYGDDMTMERWVMLDAGVMPGGVVGFGKDADHIDDQTAALLDVPEEYNGIVPVTESAGAFTVDGAVFGHAFASLHKGRGLGMLSTILRAEVYPQDTWEGVIQWDNVTQMVYSKLGEMTIQSPSLPPHSKPESSLVYRLELDMDGLSKPLMDDLSESFDYAVGKDDTELIQYIKENPDDNTFYIVPPGAVFNHGEPHVTVKEG